MFSFILGDFDSRRSNVLILRHPIAGVKCIQPTKHITSAHSKTMAVTAFQEVPPPSFPRLPKPKPKLTSTSTHTARLCPPPPDPSRTRNELLGFGESAQLVSSCRRRCTTQEPIRARSALSSLYSFNGLHRRFPGGVGGATEFGQEAQVVD